MKVLERMRACQSAVGIVRNVIVRDEDFRKKGEGYWRREGQIMTQVMDDKEVLEGVRNALSRRINMAKVEEDAKQYAEGLIRLHEGQVTVR